MTSVFERTITEVQRTNDGVLLRRDCGHVAYWAGAASQWPQVGQVEQCLTCQTEEPEAVEDRPDCIFCGKPDHWSVDCPEAGA